MQDATVSQLHPMSISVQSGCAPSANTVIPESSSKIDNPKEAVNKDNPPVVVQKNAAEQDVKKTKTIQHLLSDWRTAYAKNKKVILLDLSFYLILLICFQETTAGKTNTPSVSQPPPSRSKCDKEGLKINSGSQSLKVIFSNIIIIINKCSIF